MHTSTRIGLVLLLCVSPTFANDYYVDALAGNNANPGTSPGTAWQTISFALGQLPTTGMQRVFVAPGTYDTSLGESFPLNMRPMWQIYGSAGAVLDGSNAPVSLVLFKSNSTTHPYAFHSDSLVDGLRLTGAAVGIDLDVNNNVIEASIANCAIDHMSAAGIRTSGRLLDTNWSGLTIEQCNLGIDFRAGDGAGATVHLSDSVVRGCSSHGISVFVAAGAFTGIGVLFLERCRVEGNGGDGVHCNCINRGAFQVVFTDSAFVGNSGSGAWLQQAPVYGPQAAAWFRSCTSSRNFIGLKNNSVPDIYLSISESIIFGNTIETSPVTPQSTFSDIGTNQPVGPGQNLNVDPLFVNAANGDFRLQPGSQCIDSGDPAQALDPDCSPSDMGAFAYSHVSPRVYCSAKINSCGSLPAIAWTGAPSASATSGFVVHVSNAKGLKPGLFLYTNQGAGSTPFGGGTLCLNPAGVKRSPSLIDTSGHAGQCDGTLAIDISSFAHGLLGGTPLAALKTAGAHIHGQFWGRDAPNSALLSDAIEYFVCP